MPDLEPFALLPELQDPTLFPERPSPSLGIPPLAADPSLLRPAIDVDVPHPEPDVHLPPQPDTSSPLSQYNYNPQWLLPLADGPLAHYAEAPPAPSIPPPVDQKSSDDSDDDAGLHPSFDPKSGVGSVTTGDWNVGVGFDWKDTVFGDSPDPRTDLRPQDKLPGMEDDD